jgi:NAD(P)H-dependent FMN reductase
MTATAQTESTPLRIPVLLGSVRRDRMGARAGRLMMKALEERGHRPVLVDPLELQLPLLDRMYKEYPTGGAPEVLEKLASLYLSADGFLVVSGEYNHGIPPALKNLLDHFLDEYFFRPSGIVCYSAGAFGGVRAAMQLRVSLAEMGMSSVPSLLPIPRVGEALGEDGTPVEARLAISSDRFLNEFLWYASALKAARTKGTPY